MREKRFCKADGCTNQLDKRNVSGLCYTHYARGKGPHISGLRSYESLRERNGDVARSLEIRIQEELFPRYSDTTREWLNELANPLEGEFEVFDPKFENWGPCVRQKTEALKEELAKTVERL